MPSTFDGLLRLELQATGENENTWGDKANTNFELIAAAIAGHVSVGITGSGDYTLTTANAATDEARQAYLTLSGTLVGNRTLIIPTSAKLYIIRNNTVGAFTISIKTATGAAATIAPSGLTFVACDGLDCRVLSDANKLDLVGGAMTGPLAVAVSTSVSTQAAVSITQSGAGPALTITSGRVGVGLTDPADSIHVVGGGIIADNIGKPGVSSTFTVYVQASAAGPRAVFSGVSAPTNQGAIEFYTTSTVPAIIALGTTARVGIHTSAPQATLDINGDLRVRDGITIGDAPLIIPTGDAPLFPIRAWGRINGNTGGILGSGNVASCVRNAVGDYTITFTTPMDNPNYGIMVWTSNNLGASGGFMRFETNPTVNSFRVQAVRVDVPIADFDPATWSFIIIQ
jgi:hypothetical protein